MARMSIDDKFLRDPRVTQLALDLGISRWEAMGRLLAVFAVCYDLERDVITPAQVDLAADRPGLADALFAVDLAVTTRRGLRIRGVKKRIEYLAPKREAGRQGGIKSGESRRNSAKQKLENREATVNPPDPVPDLPPDPVPDQIPDLPPARDPAVRAPDTTLHAPPPAPVQPSPPETSLEALWSEFEAERQRVARSLRIELLPLAAHDRGRHDIAHALATARAAGDRALEVKRIRHAIAVAGAEAEGAQDSQWLTGAVFTADNLRRLSSTTPAKARQAAADRRAATQARARGGSGRPEVPSMPTPEKFPPLAPEPPMSAEDRAEIAALGRRLAENPTAVAVAELAAGRVPAHLETPKLVRLFGDGERTPPRSADRDLSPTDDEHDQPDNHRRGKAT